MWALLQLCQDTHRHAGVQLNRCVPILTDGRIIKSAALFLLSSFHNDNCETLETKGRWSAQGCLETQHCRTSQGHNGGPEVWLKLLWLTGENAASVEYNSDVNSPKCLLRNSQARWNSGKWELNGEKSAIESFQLAVGATVWSQCSGCCSGTILLLL